MSSTRSHESTLPKALSGIRGLDEITGGGLPRGRPTLVCGGPGCGKTLLAAEFLVRGATEYDEPGVLMVFEETVEDIVANVSSMGFALDRLVAEGKIYIDHVRVQRHEIEEAGDYDLEGLFVRLAHAIDKVGAKRVALDTIETLFSGFQNPAILRSELKRLFQWLKDRGMTAVITGERGEATLTRNGLEEYVSDCVIALDHRVDNQVSTRRLRVVKYRGSVHGTNEYPFLIDEQGITVVPITSVGLDHAASDERISSGIAGMDEMLGGLGFFRGTSVLFSGTAGTGKTTASAHFAEAACRRGERTLYFAFEESPAQIERNMRSVGLKLAPHVERGVLRFQAARPSVYGLEMHLARVLHAVEEFDPQVVVLDPITALLGSAPSNEVRGLVTRLIDSLKSRGITALFTTLSGGDQSSLEQTDLGISSLVDAWVLLRDVENNGERNRVVYVLKARGIAHSNQVREFLITSGGVELVPAYVGAEGVLTGSSRVAQQTAQSTADAARQLELERLRRRLEHRRAAAEAQAAALHAEFAAEQAEYEAAVAAAGVLQDLKLAAEREIARSRKAQPVERSPESRG
jgi:circadian clock protein KaiC